MNVRLMLIAGATLLAGCATPVANYQPRTTDISEPPLGSVNTRQVGEELLKQGKYREHDALRVDSAVKPIWAYTVHPGYFLKIGEDQAGEYYRIGNAGEESGWVEKSSLADPYQSLMVKKETGDLCVVTIMNVAGCGGAKANFERVKRPVVAADTIQRTLIYSGKIGNKVNISYREFAGSIARPAFSNNVEYDLAESNQIGYKGALIEILEATNRSIRYKVISNFNAAER